MRPQIGWKKIAAPKDLWRLVAQSPCFSMPPRRTSFAISTNERCCRGNARRNAPSAAQCPLLADPFRFRGFDSSPLPSDRYRLIPACPWFDGNEPERSRYAAVVAGWSARPDPWPSGGLLLTGVAKARQRRGDHHGQEHRTVGSGPGAPDCRLASSSPQTPSTPPSPPRRPPRAASAGARPSAPSRAAPSPNRPRNRLRPFPPPRPPL